MLIRPANEEDFKAIRSKWTGNAYLEGYCPELWAAVSAEAAEAFATAKKGRYIRIWAVVTPEGVTAVRTDGTLSKLDEGYATRVALSGPASQAIQAWVAARCEADAARLAASGVEVRDCSAHYGNSRGF
jgi:hypothetical protein